MSDNKAGDKTLICTVGLPRSGKSTWSRSQSYPIVNPDSVRLAIHGQRYVESSEPFVWATVRAMVRALFLAGHDTVILDSCCNTRKRRNEWQVREWDEVKWKTVFKVIDTPADVCIERANAENDHYIVPHIKRMAVEHEPIQDDELRFE